MTGTLRLKVSSYRAPKTQIPSKSVSFKELYRIKLNETLLEQYDIWYWETLKIVSEKWGAQDSIHAKKKRVFPEKQGDGALTYTLTHTNCVTESVGVGEGSERLSLSGRK